MRSNAREWWIPLFVCAALALVAGCSSDDGSNPATEQTVQSDVQSGSLAAALAAPSAEASEELILALLATLGAPAAPQTAGPGVSPAVSPPACPEPSFDLGNGITGTCSVSDQDVVTFTFSGTMMADGASVAVEGSLVATPLDNGSGSGTGFSVEFEATANGPQGTATWTVSGTVFISEGGVATDYDLTMTQIVAPTAGPGMALTITVTPESFGVLLAGESGLLELELDRSSMTGVVRLNGIEVAVVSIVGGCATVDFVNPEITDETFCPQA